MGLTHGELFAGVSGFGLGFERADFESRWMVEFEPWAQEVLKRHWPDVPLYGDVSTVNGAELEPVDIITYGFPCFPAGTLIDTYSGSVPIENVRVGDSVVTHEGRYRSVTTTMRRNAEATLTVKALGCAPIVTTPEHPFWVRRRRLTWNNDLRRYVRIWDAPRWVQAQELTKDDFLCQLMQDPEINTHIPLGEELAYIVGRWLGDGWLVTTKRKSENRINSQVWKALICCAQDEADNLAKRIDVARLHATRSDERTVTKFHISSMALVRLLADFGRGAAHKRVAGWVFRLPRADQAALLRGWLDADGSMQGENERGASISRELIHGMARLARSVHGVAVSIHHTKRKPTCIIEGRVVNQSDSWMVVIPPVNREAIVEDGWAWVPVRSVTPSDGCEVFNLSVDEDESYIADGAVVHNCTDLSVAGRREGLDGARSGLFFQATRIIREMREATGGRYPTWALAENVPGLFSADGGLAMGRVLDELAELGAVDICWRVLDSKHYGVAQRRRRVFILACFDARAAGRSPLFLDSQGSGGGVEAGVEEGAGVARPVGGSTAKRGLLAGDGTTVQGLTGSFANGGADDNKAQAGWLVPAAAPEPNITESTGTITANWHKGAGNTQVEMGILVPVEEPSDDPVAYACQGTNVGEFGTLRAGNGHLTGGVPFVAQTVLGDQTHALTASPGSGRGSMTEDGTGRGTPIVNTYSVYPESGQGTDIVATETDMSPTLSAEGLAKTNDRKPGTAGTLQQNKVEAVAYLPPDEPIPFDTTQITSHLNYSRPQAGDPCHPLAAGAHAPAIAFKTQNTKANGSNVFDDESFSLQAEGSPPAVAFQERGRDGGRNCETQEDIAYALTAPTGGGRAHERNIMTPQMAVRRLTPRECERLQAFPDDWTRWTADGREIADSHRYRMMGNAVTTTVAQAIAERILQVQKSMDDEL
jgi:site-specific DNA-cytosine methylase